MAELDRLDRAYGLGAMPSSSTRRTRRGRRSRGSVLPVVLVTAVLFAAIVALAPTENMLGIRRLFGFDDDRLATAPRVPQGLGSYTFLKTQRGSNQPVAYDPCRPIQVVVNPEGAPDDYDQLVDTGLRHTGDATGLQFTRVGLTDDRSVGTGGLVRRQRVLIAWATPEEVPALAGEVAGIGGSVAVGPPGRMRYVTGKVMLDRDLFASYDANEAKFAQAIVDHELGHVVGLGHVEDPGELMNERNVGRTTYGPGDREGLARLGGVGC